MRRDSYARMVRIYFVYITFSAFIDFSGDGFFRRLLRLHVKYIGSVSNVGGGIKRKS